MIFASKNAFNLFTQSRRDDLMSLCYVLIYLIDGDLAFLKQEDEMEHDVKDLTESQPPAETFTKNSNGSASAKEARFKEDEFVRLRRAKNALKPESLTDSDEGIQLLPFMKECFSYRFVDTPNYDKLRFLLMKVLLDNDLQADNQMDWNIDFAVQDDPSLP